MRVKVLAKDMVAALEIMDALEKKAFDLYVSKYPEHHWVKEQLSQQQAAPQAPEYELPSAKHVVEAVDAGGATAFSNLKGLIENGDGGDEDDLIEMKIRAYVLSQL
jgi:hypothetical protein